MINEFGVGFATWVPEPQSWAPNAFDKLNPGHSYYIVFAEVAAEATPEEKTVTIPGLACK